MPPILYPRKTVFTTVLLISRPESSSLAPVRHHSPTRQTFIGTYLSAEVHLLSQTCPIAVAVARATLCPLHSTCAHKANERQLPDLILQPAVNQVCFVHIF